MDHVWPDEARGALQRIYPDVQVMSSQQELLEAFPPSDWASLVGPLDPPPVATELSRLASRSFSFVPSSPGRYVGTALQPPAPATPKPKQVRPREKTNRAHGPTWLRDPFKRRGRA